MHYSENSRTMIVNDLTVSYTDEGIGNWLNGIGLSASSYATAQCLIALRDTDLRRDLSKIKIPTVIKHGKKIKYAHSILPAR